MNNIRQGRTTLEMARVHMDALALCYEVVELAEKPGVPHRDLEEC
jgi:hypothetical protein